MCSGWGHLSVRCRTAGRYQEGIVFFQDRAELLEEYIDLARAKSEVLDNIYSLFKPNIKWCNAKRRRQRRRTVKKTTLCLCSKKATHFFCTFFCRCFARLQSETSRNFLVTRYRTCSRSFSFFSASHFHLALVAASISYFLISPPLQNFHVVFQQKMSCFLSLALDLCRPFPR